MKLNSIRILALSVIAVAACAAEAVDAPKAGAPRSGGDNGIVGTWEASVTVVNCQTKAVIRNIRSLQLFHADSGFTETSGLGTRGPSIGNWFHEKAQTYGARFSFFRYNPDGSFASIAKAVNMITLSPDGNQFNVTATIQDYDANNNLISTGCVIQTAKRI